MENPPWSRPNIGLYQINPELLETHCSMNPWDNEQQDIIDEYGNVVFRGWFVAGYGLRGNGRHGRKTYIFRTDRYQETIGNIPSDDQSYRQPDGEYREIFVSSYDESKHGYRPLSSLWIYCKIIEPTPENRARKANVLKEVEEYGMLPANVEHGFAGGPLFQDMGKNWGKKLRKHRVGRTRKENARKGSGRHHRKSRKL